MKKQQTLCVVILFCLVGMLTSCGGNGKEKPLVRVFNYYLYPSDIEGALGNNISKEDSIAFINNYIEQWIQQMVVLEKAQNNITKNFDKELKNYKNSLLTYEYEQKIVEQLLDTNVSEDEIVKYYEANKANFLLKNNIVRMLYIKVPKTSLALGKIKNLMFTGGREVSDKQIVELQKLASMHAQEYFFDTQVWIPFSDFQRMIPVETYNEEMYMQNNKNITIVSDTMAYIARILEFKVIDDVSPLSFEYSNIKNILLTKRKIAIIEKMQLDLLRTAELGNNIEYFYDRKK